MVLKVYKDQMADKEQICELCTVPKIVYINFMNICKIHVNFAKTTFYLTKWLCTMHNSEAILKELTNQPTMASELPWSYIRSWESLQSVRLTSHG
jgi:hypothetical protein